MSAPAHRVLLLSAFTAGRTPHVPLQGCLALATTILSSMSSGPSKDPPSPFHISLAPLHGCQACLKEGPLFSGKDLARHDVTGPKQARPGLPWCVSAVSGNLQDHKSPPASLPLPSLFPGHQRINKMSATCCTCPDPQGQKASSKQTPNALCPACFHGSPGGGQGRV